MHDGPYSKYGSLRLGRADETPEFNDITWFAMLFSCGIGVGIYYYGVSEPMYYYRGSSRRGPLSHQALAT